ncbi:MAG: hypothetical protein K8T91_06240 [Planctomycetes bacterium]|nr:hypothetical protein [Planctomycetota bacterium]
MANVSIAEHVSDTTIVHAQGEQPTTNVSAISVAPPFRAIENLLGESRPLIRPNRNQPIHDDPAVWKSLDQEAFSAAEFDEIAAYLKATGQESA